MSRARIGAVIGLLTAAIASCVDSRSADPPPSRSPNPDVSAGTPSTRRLRYNIDLMSEPGIIRVINGDSFTWDDVRVEIGDEGASFHCSVPSTIGVGGTFPIQRSGCRSADSQLAAHVCVVRLMTKQGVVTAGIEPCAPLR